MEITITDDKCWICGTKFEDKPFLMNKTNHHTLPKHLKPVNNVSSNT